MNSEVAAALRGCQRIGVLVGAGISVASGIPDFRSPGGLYATLRPELLTAPPNLQRLMRVEPTAVVSWDVFQRTPLPYHEVRRPFILGLADRRWRPTLAHFVLRVAQDRGRLAMVFNQNIDGLVEMAGVSRCVAVHGSIGAAQCEYCEEVFPAAEFVAAVRAQIKDIYGEDPSAPAESTPILCRKCHKPGVKPATVLFGRSLPKQFLEAKSTIAPTLDALVVAGTSLAVSPANHIPSSVSGGCLRLLVNRERVGELCQGSERDVFLQGDCDEGFLVLAEVMGWVEDVAGYADQMCEASRERLLAYLAKRGGDGGASGGALDGAPQTGSQ